MYRTGFVTHAEYQKHIRGEWRTVHNLWPHIKNYVPGYGYSKVEIDAMFVNITDTGTEATNVAAGTTGQRPGGVVGDIRYNSNLVGFEVYTGVWQNIILSGYNPVSAAVNITDHAIVRGDGGARGVQDTGILVDDNDVMTFPNGGSISLQEDITFTGATAQNLIKFPDNLPTAFDFRQADTSYLKFRTSDGTEGLTIGKTLTLSSIPAGIADYNKFLVSDTGVVKYRTGAEVLADIGGLANIVEDTTPQLGGDLDLNAHNIDFPSTANISDCKDEDDLASDSATMLATQQSIKAYVDAAGGGGDVTAAANIDANAVVIGDDGAKGVKKSTMLVSDAGEMTNPSQPAFLAYNSVADPNVTGDGTAVKVDFNTEVFDQGGNFAADTFTAPVTGKYRFEINVTLGNMNADTYETVILYFLTSNRSFLLAYNDGRVYTAVGHQIFNGSVLIDMDANDVAYVSVIVVGGTKSVGVIGDTPTAFTFFSGSLVC